MNKETFDKICGVLGQCIEKRYSCQPNFVNFCQNREEHPGDIGCNTMMMLNSSADENSEVKQIIFRITSEEIHDREGLQFTVSICYSNSKLSEDTEEQYTTTIANLLEDALQSMSIKSSVVCVTKNAIKSINVKTEMCFSELLLTNANKRYGTSIPIQEGKVIDPSRKEINRI